MSLTGRLNLSHSTTKTSYVNRWDVQIFREVHSLKQVHGPDPNYNDICFSGAGRYFRLMMNSFFWLLIFPGFTFLSFQNSL